MADVECILNKAERYNLSDEEIEILINHHKRCKILSLIAKKRFNISSCSKCGKPLKVGSVYCHTGRRSRRYLCSKCFNSLYLDID